MEENNNTNTTPETPPEEPKKSGSILDTPDTTADYDPADIEKNKGMTILAYIGILVIIPILAVKDSPYTRYHCNQGLILLICGVIAGVIGAIPVLGWILGGILGLVVFVLFVLGLLNAINGRAKELPVIGKYRLLK